MNFKAKKFKIFFFLFLIFIVIFLLNIFSKETRSFFYSVSLPVQKVLWKTGNSVSDFIIAIAKTKSFKNEADELREKNRELLFELAVLSKLKTENEFLRSALNIGLEKEFKLCPAQIISKDISQDFILIDKGADDGISENMAVITQEKVLLGKIVEIYDKFSKIMLITNKKSSFDAEIIGKDVNAAAKGKGNLEISLELIPRDKEISQGDTVITSSLGGFFPAGLLTGQIKEIKKNDIESLQEAKIEPFFKIGEIEHLFVIIGY